MRTPNLCQINVGRLLAPVGDPGIADVVAQVPEVNALAESSPGFVWRLKSDSGNAYRRQHVCLGVCGRTEHVDVLVVDSRRQGVRHLPTEDAYRALSGARRDARSLFVFDRISSAVGNRYFMTCWMAALITGTMSS